MNGGGRGTLLDAGFWGCFWLGVTRGDTGLGDLAGEGGAVGLDVGGGVLVVEVAHGGFDVGVAHEDLDVLYGTVVDVEHVRAERVAEGVESDVFLETGFFAPVLHGHGESVGVEGAAFVGDKDEVGVAALGAEEGDGFWGDRVAHESSGFDSGAADK